MARLKRTVITRQEAKSPFKVGLALAVLYIALLTIFFGSSSIGKIFHQESSDTGLVVWSILAIVSAMIVLIGACISCRAHAMLLFMPGLTGLGFVLMAYSVAAYEVVENPLQSAISPLTFILAFACWYRVFQIIREFKEADASVKRDKRAAGYSVTDHQQASSDAAMLAQSLLDHGTSEERGRDREER